MKGFVRVTIKPKVIKAMRDAVVEARELKSKLKENNCESLYLPQTKFQKFMGFKRKPNDAAIESARIENLLVCYHSYFGMSVYTTEENLVSIINLGKLGPEVNLGEELALTYNRFIRTMKDSEIMESASC